MKLTITVESEEQKQKILDVLENAEMEGELDFSFSVKAEEGLNLEDRLLHKLKQCQFFLEGNHPKERHLIATIKSLVN
tara:strand:+ start:69 stop:302 length:234 start_codon:yes stop_codon:yes gene_type:complete